MVVPHPAHQRRHHLCQQTTLTTNQALLTEGLMLHCPNYHPLTWLYTIVKLVLTATWRTAEADGLRSDAMVV